MQVLIVEDEAPAVERLENLLLEYDKDIEVLDALNSVDSTVEWLQSHKAPDLIFLDIHLADGLSFEIFKKTEVKCPVIFCTAYDQYALQAFEVNSIGYLLKPVQYQRLENSLNKLKNLGRSRLRDFDSDMMSGLMNLIGQKDANYKSRFMVKIGNRIKAVKTSDIAYFHSRDKLTFLVTRDDHSFPVDYSLDDLIQLLNPASFFHVNRSLIIHIDAAKEIHPHFKGRLKLVLQPPLDEEVIVSSQRTPLFKVWLDQ